MVDVSGAVDAADLHSRLRVYRLSELKPYEKNARKHSKRQLEVLAAQIKASGFNAPIAVWRDGLVLAGHGRMEAAKRAGLAEVPGIDCSHLSLLEARKFILADNRIAEMAKWDDDVLKAELSDLHELSVDFADVGFSPNELSKLVVDFDLSGPRRQAAREAKPTTPKPWTEVRAEAEQQAAAPASAAPDAAPAAPVEVAPPPKGDQAELWILPDPESANERAIAEADTDPLLGPVIAAEGELWIIPADPENPEAGEHRLVCGSCLDADTVARVCGEGEAAMLLTDPPYGVDYAGKVKAQNKALGLKGNETEIASDDLPLEKLREFLGAAFANARTALRPGGRSGRFQRQVVTASSP